MESTKQAGQRAVVGSTQLPCETYIQLKPPMSMIIREKYTAEITDNTVFKEKALFKGKVEHMIYYLHVHGKKANNEQKEDGESNRDSDAETVDEFKVYDGEGTLVDTLRGIVHFHQQFFEFTGTADITGVVPNDVVTGTANITYDPFIATVVDDNGLISGGEQKFYIDVTLTK